MSDEQFQPPRFYHFQPIKRENGTPRSCRSWTLSAVISLRSMAGDGIFPQEVAQDSMCAQTKRQHHSSRHGQRQPSPAEDAVFLVGVFFPPTAGLSDERSTAPAAQTRYCTSSTLHLLHLYVQSAGIGLSDCLGFLLRGTAAQQDPLFSFFENVPTDQQWRQNAKLRKIIINPLNGTLGYLLGHIIYRLHSGL